MFNWTGVCCEHERDVHLHAPAGPVPQPRRTAARRRPGVDPPARRLVRTLRPPLEHPHGLGALGGGAPGPERHLGPGAAGVRLLGLPAEVLRGHLLGPRSAAARRQRHPAGALGRQPRAPGRVARARPRRLRAAGGDVPRGRRPRPPDVDADPGPAPALRARPPAGAPARRGDADRRVRLHHPQPALVQPGRPGPTASRRRPRRSSTTGPPRRWSARTSTRSSTS